MRAESEREEEIATEMERQLGVSIASYRDAGAGCLTLSAYLHHLDASRERVRHSLARSLRIRLDDVSIRRLPRENWATSWRRHFTPLEIGAGLLIKPSWSRRRARAGQRVVILDPGLSFGTGHHATTEFCLRQLVDCRQRGAAQSFLDVGSGSGILAIAAAKLGYAPIEAFDFDPEAVRSAQANIRRNRVAEKVSLRCDDLTRLRTRGARRFDVICANVTYDLLASQARKLSQLLARDGRLMAAGILVEQFSVVTKKFQQFGLTLGESELNNIWRSGQFAFRSDVQRRKDAIEGNAYDEDVELHSRSRSQRQTSLPTSRKPTSQSPKKPV